MRGIITYANVVATLALFVALGGVSYAVVTLPADSVGSRQLRPRSVTRRALAFPTGAASRTDLSEHELRGNFCNGWPLSPGQPAPPCPARPKGGRTPGREVSLTLNARGMLVVLATVGVANQGLSNTQATVTIETIVDGRAFAERSVVVRGGDATQATVQGAFALPPGKHAVGIGFAARYTARGPSVLVGPTTLTAMAFPHLGAAP
jgi:hypothetical protein